MKPTRIVLDKRVMSEGKVTLGWAQPYERPCKKHGTRTATSSCIHCLRRGWWLIWRAGRDRARREAAASFGESPNP